MLAISKPQRLLRAIALVCLLPLVGCASLVNNAAQGFADNLSDAILNSNDPQLVRDGAPSFLLLLDSLLGEDTRSAELFAAGSSLNSAYSAAFVSEPHRQKLFAQKAFTLAQRAACLGIKDGCELREREFSAYKAWALGLKDKDVELGYELATAWAGWIQANSDDWAAIAELERVKVLMGRIAELAPAYSNGGPVLYLGVFETLVGPAQGGRPEVGRAHFERAIELGGGKFLPAKVFFAQQYARLVFDRELHDKLLSEVVGADPESDGLTLINLIAQEQARELLASADDYF